MRRQVNEMQRSASEALSSLSGYFTRLSEQQKQLEAEARALSDLVTDIGAYVAARALEEADALSPTDANAIASESVEKISAKSERWGRLAKAFNDMMLKKSRR